MSLVLALVSCDRGRSDPPEPTRDAAPTSAITNRVAIPASVRRNLGITFARVESRAVANTLRVPGRFEWLPTARREHRAPLPGRVELLVTQYQRVEPGTPLYRLHSSAWLDLSERIAGASARVESMGPLREAHRVHERSLVDKVALWQDRLNHLDVLREAGGGSAAQFTDARAALNATQAELAEVMEKDAQLGAEQKQAEAELRSLNARREGLLGAGSCAEVRDSDRELVGCAVEQGVIEDLHVTQGGLAEENALIVTIVQPEKIRFRARGLQSDLGRLHDGLDAGIVPPQGGSIALQSTMQGTLHLGPAADADSRTIDLIVQPRSLQQWARAGVSASLEIVLEDGEGELAIPLSAVTRDGVTPIIFRRDPKNPDQVIRMEADLGIDDGRWIVIKSGVAEGDEVVLEGVYQLMLATAGNVSKGGHFHPDGTFHEGDH